MIKALIFDLDQTLVVYTKRTIDRTDLNGFLRRLKNNAGVYMAVASFNNIYGPDIIATHFPNLFDCVVCDPPADCDDWSKINMLQKIRKQYSRDMKIRHNRSTKLKWREMLMFDDNENVIQETTKQRPDLKCIPVNEKTGLTCNNRTLIQLMNNAVIDDEVAMNDSSSGRELGL